MATYLQPDPYAILGVRQDATLAEIRSAHRKMVLKCHPDKVQDLALKKLKIDEFQSIQQAYELLSNETRRLQHDQQVALLQLKETKKSSIESNDPPKISEPINRLETKQKSYVAQDRASQTPTRKNASIFGKQDLVIGDSPRPRSSTKGLNLPTMKNRSNEIKVVKGHLDGLETYAIPDTGAEFNIMAAEFARITGLSINSDDPSNCRLLCMANGKHIQTIGVVDVRWCFALDPSQEWKLTFHILADFVYDLILGSHFLFATQTMSHHKERLSTIPRPLQSLSVLRVNVIGSASRQVRGSLHNERVNALPDSGSEPNLLSYEYVKRRGWLLDMNVEDQNLLQFADGSLEKTEGSLSARWVFPVKPGTKKKRASWKVQFHVLRGCSHNVILGQDVLDKSNAFREQADAFLDTYSDTRDPGLNLVIWLPKKKKVENPSNNQSLTDRHPARQTTDLHTELQRLAEVDRRINRMPPGPLKEAALEVEDQRRREYDSLASNPERQTLSAGSSANNSIRTISVRVAILGQYHTIDYTPIIQP